ncbi:MAG: tetratricopeptide repeat protein [Weeksellaceae bacterium]|nr:tetratricopeptide repeat protein [Weeksellaceae bacterium]
MSKKKKEQKTATEEVFQSLEHTAQRSEHFLEKNAKILGLVFGALVLVAMGYFAYLRFVQEPRNAEAMNEIGTAVTMFDNDSMQLALHGSPGAYMGLEEVIENYGGTDVGNLAKYYAGIARYETGDYQGAIDILGKFNTNEAATKAMKHGAMGDAFVQLGDKDKAIKEYEKAVNASNLETMQRIFVKKGAILAHDMGQPDKGLKLIDDFVKMYGEADMEIMRLHELLKYSGGQ